MIWAIRDELERKINYYNDNQKQSDLRNKDMT